ncbi:MULTISPECIES: DUF2199 domain-containing protein [unclassified Kitasatospora]|uniref:DUF2199 domain-containing protein n=1 Tax=unclassified Kitasatospora TaxID=2633591 RepID=UPI00070B2D73|nr:MULTISPECIES: DUF2199 domain-containing protein [unclassified Kitasatospora]KQV14287.1 hypothetical protein ASC99_31980 [Kitasatospora sp. Root107]KRB72379.1 hypothetical protein ASE03_22925 [Kitasatospora sp. Root187]
MSAKNGFTCTCCGEHHAEIPLNFSSPAPAYWLPEMGGDSKSVLSPDQCVIQDESFFVQGLIEIPVIGSDDVFSWGVWVSLSRPNFDRASDLWETAGRETEPPYFGWLSTELFLYSPSTINLKTMLHTRPVGERPFIELEPTDHPLAVEQRTGITMERVQQIAEAVLHPEN